MKREAEEDWGVPSQMPSPPAEKAVTSISVTEQPRQLLFFGQTDVSVNLLILRRWNPRLSVAAASLDDGLRMRAKMKRLIAALIVGATIVLVTMAVIRHVNHKQHIAWCYDHGYANYATEDGFCVGARGKLIKVGL